MCMARPHEEIISARCMPTVTNSGKSVSVPNEADLIMLVSSSTCSNEASDSVRYQEFEFFGNFAHLRTRLRSKLHNHAVLDKISNLWRQFCELVVACSDEIHNASVQLVVQQNKERWIMFYDPSFGNENVVQKQLFDFLTFRRFEQIAISHGNDQ
ncbi:hypothetical protein OGAPHI_000244 [Ogataea philodendri]|uniref:Uncharacterized protein n=1 Tax=Ogataea philodendri TaxID=1378263 RepID=A0A9P8TAX6_9ASCO|nr:uncharacterized protein OGAPHI_000244 [Ogataea philodendri]KAH3671541.1 hypothetical protein OGAPHI_000244 [Ogataea philodendri]